MEERRHQLPLSEEDLNRIADAVAKKARETFHIGEEEHYNSHKRLDKLLEAYDSASNAFTKAFFGLVILGAITLAGLAITKGFK